MDKVLAAFLDRDGVIIQDCGYPHREDQLIFINGAARAIHKLNSLGYLVVIVTNQSGVGRGFFTEDEMTAFNNLLVQRLSEAGGEVAAVYACPFHPEATRDQYRHPDHPDRKPNPGMILKALVDHGIDPNGSIMIGDQETDMEAARRAGVRGLKFEGGDLGAFVEARVQSERASL